MVSKKKNQKKGETSNNEAKSPSSSSVMVTKKIKKQRSSGGSGNFVADPMIKDPRFSQAHTDPRFRRLSRRDAKVTIDSRFEGVLTDKASAPVDKRGKKRRSGSGKDSLREYYRIEDKDESESEEEEMKNLKAEAKRRKSEEDKKKKDESENESEEEMKSEEEPSEEESKSEELKLASSSSSDEKSESEEVSEEVSEEEEEEDTDEDDEAMYVEEDGFEIPEEEITNIDKETHRLAVVNMDWRHISAKDLYVVFNSFVPKDGRIVSVSVYPTELGLERMKDEEIHGPKIDINKKKDQDNDSNSESSSSSEEEDEDIMNQKRRAYEITRLKYYFAVIDCDSVTTADCLYKSCDGIEFESSSNKLDIRFIPDTMEFKHPPRDTATELPSNYQGLVFQTQALQMSKVGVSWDEDEPHRAKTLNQKFNPDQLAELEKQEYIADYSGDESDNEDGGNKYRALIDVKDSDNEEEEKDEKMDMEVTFHDGLEDLSKTVREKKEQKRSETVWDKSVREMKEKKKERKKNKKKNDSSSSSDGDDFFMEEAKPKKKAKKAKEEVAVEEERNRAELELLLADDENGNGNGGEGVKGYNIKKKKKKIVEEEEKIVPMVELDQPRFATKLFSDPNYALDPTDPQFKRSASYVRQLAQKQKEVPRSQEEVKEATTTTMEEKKPESKKKTERHETSNAIKSVKMKMKNQQKDSEERKKKTGNAESSSTTTMTLAKIKKKIKDLSKK